MISDVKAGDVRVRFAPSPTGMFHVGGARSALFNWLHAKRHGGRFVLRIEDTDAARNRPEWVDGILSALEWIGISDRDPTFEGPYFQSDQAAKHGEVIHSMLAAGSAYYCDCSREAISARMGNSHGGYDGFCRDRGLAVAAGRAVRFRTPDEGEVTVVDLIRGQPEFEAARLEDFVIARGDSSSTFLLANAVDDVTMGITHVIRGEEHLPNAPRQQLLWQAMGAEPPVWAHVPVIVNSKRQKLSKRRDKVALEDYRDEGYQSEAMKNSLMLLGWSPGDVEIVPWQQIEARFRLEDVTSAPAFFDEQKLRAINGQYLRALPVEEFIDACNAWMAGPGVAALPWLQDDYDPQVFTQLAPLVQTRAAVLSEVVSLVDHFFLPEPSADEASWQRAMKGGAGSILVRTIEAIENAPGPRTTSTGHWTGVAANADLNLRKAQAPVRVAITGRAVGLPLFESVVILGRERTLRRLDTALARLEREQSV